MSGRINVHGMKIRVPQDGRRDGDPDLIRYLEEQGCPSRLYEEDNSD